MMQDISVLDWRQMSDSSEQPLTWGADDNVKWKARFPGAGASSPIVAQGKLYVIDYTGYAVPGNRSVNWMT